jgi:hypothetical protein
MGLCRKKIINLPQEDGGVFLRRDVFFFLQQPGAVVADVEGRAAPSPLFLPEIYQLMIVKLKILDPKFVNVFALSGDAPPPFLERPLLFEISGSATGIHPQKLHCSTM